MNQINIIGIVKEYCNKNGVICFDLVTDSLLFHCELPEYKWYYPENGDTVMISGELVRIGSLIVKADYLTKLSSKLDKKF